MKCAVERDFSYRDRIGAISLLAWAPSFHLLTVRIAIERLSNTNHLLGEVSLESVCLHRVYLGLFSASRTMAGLR